MKIKAGRNKKVGRIMRKKLNAFYNKDHTRNKELLICSCAEIVAMAVVFATQVRYFFI